MVKRKERRKPIICPNCHREMVCMNRFESICKLLKGFYVWYICPRREEEGGCGHAILLEISPKTKRPRRVVSLIEFRKDRKSIPTKK